MSNKVIAGVILFLCISVFSAAENVCPLNKLSIGALAAHDPVGFDQMTFNIEPKGSSATLRITNLGSRPINAFFMVVDFGLSGRYLLSMPFYLSTSGQDKTFVPAARVSPTFFAPAPLASSLLPGDSYRDNEKSTIRPLGCPDEAHVGVLQIVFATGSPVDYRSPGWRVDPSLLDIDSWSSSGFPMQPAAFFGRISVNENGRVRVVALSALDHNGDEDSTLSSWLIKQIENTFTYVPAQYDGAAISCEIELLIRFYPDQETDPISILPRDWVRYGVTVVDLVSASPGKQYDLIYGEYPLFGQSLDRTKSR